MSSVLVSLNDLHNTCFCATINCLKFDVDIDIGGILNVIGENVKRNASLVRNNIQIVELDFKAPKFSESLESMISDVDIVICADGKFFFSFFLKD